MLSKKGSITYRIIYDVPIRTSNKSFVKVPIGTFCSAEGQILLLVTLEASFYMLVLV